MSVNYNPKIVTDGLTLYLDFGNTKSYPGSGNTTIDLTAGILANSLNTVTIANGTARFYGNVGYNASIEVAHSNNYMSSLVTTICWAKSNNTTWNAPALLSKRPYVIFNPIANTRQILYYYYLSNVYRNTPAYVVPDITKWHQYASTWDGTNINGYVDGVLVSQATFTANTLSTTDTGPMYVGRDDGLERYLDGSVALISTYNRALSDAEILQNFNAHRGRFGV